MEPGTTPRARQATGSAPGKLILLGEHAVVFGQPGIALPLSGHRAQAVVRAEAGGAPVRLHALDLDCSGCAADAAGGLVPLARVVELARAARPGIPETGWSLAVRSDIPIARGLGSGAAVTVACLRALDAFHGLALDEPELIRLAYEVEKLHHGRPSGIDNTVVALERPVLFVRGRPPEPLPEARLDLLVADTGRCQSTAEVVAAVAERHRRQPRPLEELVERIGGLTVAGLAALRSGDRTALGRIMDENQACLAELGVSSPELDGLVAAARRAGALGAKLTGAGRGGCMIALVGSEVDRERVRAALAAAGAVRLLETRTGEAA